MTQRGFSSVAAETLRFAQGDGTPTVILSEAKNLVFHLIETLHFVQGDTRKAFNSLDS